MKCFPLLTLACLLVAAPGCRSPQENMHDTASMWVGESLRAASLQQAILAQATLYPYHFETGTATLNELGRRDLELLATYFHDHPGTLNVRRGSASQAAYDARLTAVHEALAAAGVDARRITLADGLPGGDGDPSTRVLRILEREIRNADTMFSDTEGGISSSGSGVGTGSVQQ